MARFKIHFLLCCLLTSMLKLVGCELIDLTYIFNTKTVYWGNWKRFKHTVIHQGRVNENIAFYSTFDFSAGEHGGTHLDAPIHFAEGKWAVHEIPVENLVGPGIVVDIAEKAATDRNCQLTVEDLIGWENKHGRIPDGSILLVYTGWGKFWPNYENYMGTNTTDSSLYQFPGIHADASLWLVRNRKVKGVGVDTASLDYGKSKTFSSHQILLGNSIFGLENVANLEKVPTTGATIYALPMLIADGSGAPARILAQIADNNRQKSGTFLYWGYYFVASIILMHFIYTVFTTIKNIIR